MNQSPWSPQNKPTVGTKVVVNTEVTKKYPGIWTVTKKSVKNVVVKHGDGRQLRIAPEYLLPAPTDGVTTATTSGQIEMIALHPHLMIGAVVRVRASAPTTKMRKDVFYIVMKDNVDNVKLVVLGGDGDRYWPKVPRSWVEEIKITTTVAE